MQVELNYWALFGAGLLGLFVGLSELLNRYKSFERIFSNIYSGLYMLINFLASVTTYIIIKKYDINTGGLGKHEIGLSIIAGIGAMAFLRSSFFTYKDSNEKTIEVGPAALLTVFLKAAERQFDQILAEKNIKSVSIIMSGINFLSASKDLPLIILASMRVLNNEEQKLLSEEILNLVNDSTSTTEAKNIALGAILLKYTGLELLTEAVNSLKQIYNSKTKQSLEQINKIQAILRKQTI